jgi:hypothetical protein
MESYSVLFLVSGFLQHKAFGSIHVTYLSMVLVFLCNLHLCVFFSEASIQVSTHLSWVVYYWVGRVLYIFRIQVLYQMHDLQVFSPSVYLSEKVCDYLFLVRQGNDWPHLNFHYNFLDWEWLFLGFIFIIDPEPVQVSGLRFWVLRGNSLSLLQNPGPDHSSLYLWRDSFFSLPLHCGHSLLLSALCRFLTSNLPCTTVLIFIPA